MSESKRRIPLATAEGLANQLLGLLGPFCERLEVAGSIRRRKETVGDIELCAIPRFRQSHDLFGEEIPGRTFDLLDAGCDLLRDDGTLAPRLNKLGRPAWGPKLKWMIYQDFNVDLFVTDAERWGWAFCIRTGPAAFSNALVTDCRKTDRNGDVGLLPPWATYKDWRMFYAKDGEPIATPEEGDVLRWLGIGDVPPEERERWLLARRRREMSHA